MDQEAPPNDDDKQSTSSTSTIVIKVVAGHRETERQAVTARAAMHGDLSGIAFKKGGGLLYVASKIK